MSNRFFISLLVIIAVVFGVIVFSKQKDGGTGNNTTNAQPTNHVKGQNTTGVTLTEYGDFQCPACWQFEPTVKQVIEKYKDQISFQFRNFPLSQIHPNAFAAHRAVEAAEKQGKFWEMHDLLFERAHQFDQASGRVTDTEWAATTNPQPFFEQYAQQLGLDVAKFKQDAASQEVNDLINADLNEGQKLGVTGTPTFFINGKKIENPRDAEAFYKLIDEAIAEQKKS